MTTIFPAAEYKQLRALRTIHDGEKLKVDSDGVLSIDTSPSMFRKLRRDGVFYTVTALNALGMAVVQIVLDASSSMSSVKVTGLGAWEAACREVVPSLRTLSRTYRNSNDDATAAQIDRVGNVLFDCAERFSKLKDHHDYLSTRRYAATQCNLLGEAGASSPPTKIKAPETQYFDPVAWRSQQGPC